MGIATGAMRRHRNRSRTCLLAGVTALAACQTTAGDASREARARSAVSGPTAALSPRKLASGSCGLFVWRSDPAKPFILFSNAEAGAFHNGRAELAFLPTRTPLSPQQVIWVDGRAWELALRDPVQAVDGTRYDAGTLSSTTDAGWRLTIPVVGLTTCIA